MTLELLRGPEWHARSVAKAASWRAVGTLDTFLWSLIVTGKPFDAGAIAGMETVTKIGLFYLHDRIWHLVPWRRASRRRAAVMAVTWRTVGSADTFLLSWLVTGKAHQAAVIATAEALTKIGLFYGHERIWRRIRWGLRPRPPSDPAPA
jgi:uncharacterized membrane protein